MGIDKMVLTDRDYEVLRLVYRFRFCLGRHIRDLLDFSGSRTADRRLKLLVEAGYLERRKYLYGVPYLYTLAHKGRMLLGVNKRAEKIRVERILHDCYIMDAMIYCKQKDGVTLADILTEKELHSMDGFGRRRHFPDMVLLQAGKKIAVEIELALKAKERIRANCKDNCLVYDGQVWFINKSSHRLNDIINKMKDEYFNIEIIYIEDVTDYIKRANQ